jgi:hypothetical protein
LSTLSLCLFWLPKHTNIYWTIWHTQYAKTCQGIMVRHYCQRLHSESWFAMQRGWCGTAILNSAVHKNHLKESQLKTHISFVLMSFWFGRCRIWEQLIWFLELQAWLRRILPLSPFSLLLSDVKITIEVFALVSLFVLPFWPCLPTVRRCSYTGVPHGAYLLGLLVFWERLNTLEEMTLDIPREYDRADSCSRVCSKLRKRQKLQVPPWQRTEMYWITHLWEGDRSWARRILSYGIDRPCPRSWDSTLGESSWARRAELISQHSVREAQPIGEEWIRIY